jgi:hypothetical protein
MGLHHDDDAEHSIGENITFKLLKQEKCIKPGLATRRNGAAWDKDYYPRALFPSLKS